MIIHRFYYICSFEQDRPIMGITAPKIPSRNLRFFGGYTILVAGLDDGTFLVTRSYERIKTNVNSID